MAAVADAIDRLIERHGPDAICRALQPMLTPERIARIDHVLANRLTSLTVAVEDTYDPHNAAATIRTSEALGLHELHVIEPELRFSAAKGVTRGAHRWIELHRWAGCRSGGRVRCTAREGFASSRRWPAAAASITDVDVGSPILTVMFGNEHSGLSPAAVAACDGALSVPMFGFTESFNLSVTVAEAFEDQHARGAPAGLHKRAWRRAGDDLRARLEAVGSHAHPRCRRRDQAGTWRCLSLVATCVGPPP